MHSPGPGVGETCGGDSNGGDESERSSSESSREESTGRKRKKKVARRKIRGANERVTFGDIEEADVSCQDGTVCIEVAENRLECRQEDMNSKTVIAMQCQ